MNNKWVWVVVVGLIGILAGLCILMSVGVVIQTAAAPLGQHLQDMATRQMSIEAKLDKALNVKDLETRLASLETEMKTLKTAGFRGNMPQQPQAQRPQEPEMDLKTVHEIPLVGSAINGKQDAPVTIVMFTDYQCPFCGRFYPAAKEMLKTFPDKVRLVIKHFPLAFHPMAKPAAKAALAAGVQGKFYEMSDLIFQNAAALTDDKFKDFAKQIGLNVDQFAKDLKDKDAEWEKMIQGDMELANKVGVRGTPTFYLNGRQTMARAPEQWKAEIESLLKELPAKK